jgi:hypothetical protein
MWAAVGAAQRRARARHTPQGTSSCERKKVRGGTTRAGAFFWSRRRRPCSSSHTPPPSGGSKTMGRQCPGWSPGPGACLRSSWLKKAPHARAAGPCRRARLVDIVAAPSLASPRPRRQPRRRARPPLPFAGPPRRILICRPRAPSPQQSRTLARHTRLYLIEPHRSPPKPRISLFADRTSTPRPSLAQQKNSNHAGASCRLPVPSSLGILPCYRADPFLPH